MNSGAPLAPGSLAGWQIAQLLESDGPGGAENVVVHLTRALLTAGASVVTYVPRRGQGWLRGQLEGSGARFVEFALTRSFSPHFARWLGDSFRAEQIDVAHSHEFTFGVYGAWAAGRAGVAHVTTMHGGRYYAEALRRRVALGVGLHRTEEPVAVSERLRQHLAHDLWLSPRRISVVPNGIPVVPAIDPGIRATLGLPPESTILLAVGNLYAVKGHRFLVQAIADLLPRYPETHLLIAGRGDQEAPLRALADELGFAGHLHLLGLRDDIPQLLAAADLFVMPSLSEGLPIAILEAMFAGKPIVASDVGDIAAALGAGTSCAGGVVVSPGDHHALCDALAALLADPSTARAIGAAGRARAETEYHVDRMTSRYVALYRRARQRRQASATRS